MCQFIYFARPPTLYCEEYVCVCIHAAVRLLKAHGGGGIMVMIHSYLALVLRGDEGSVRRHRSLALRDRNAGTR